jgi:hypothetical protein
LVVLTLLVQPADEAENIPDAANTFPDSTTSH